MSEEATTQEAAETKAPAGAPKEEPKANGAVTEGADKKEGTDFVAFDDPKMEARFKRVYGHMKQSERVNEQLVKDNRALVERMAKLEETQDARASDERIKDLKVRKAQALEGGDWTAVADIDEQIVDLKARPKSEPKPKEEPRKSEGEEGLTPGEEKRILQWSRENDADGRPVRPWMQEDSPDFSRAMRTIRVVSNDPEIEDLETILEEVDKIMGSAKPKTTRSAAPVLSSDSSARPGTKKKITLTPEQKTVAAKMGMSEEEYAKSVAKWSRA